MGLSSIKIAGADTTGTNNDLSNWKQDYQVAAARCRLYKLSVSNISTADIYLWLFDVAAGSTASAGPVHVRYVPAGVNDTWDFGPDGGLFNNGLYLIAVDTLPADVTDTPADHTPPGDDVIILKADYRII